MLSALFAVSAAVKAKVINGTVDNSSISWEYNTETYVLTLSGSGAMPNYSSVANTPWSKEVLYTYKVGRQEYDYTITDDVDIVIVNSGITSIGNYAFTSAGLLTALQLPSTVTKIGQNAFNSCGKLETLTWEGISENLNIANTAFAGTGLVQNGILYIGTQLVFAETNISSASIKNTTTKIHANAFADCDDLTSITIPSTVTAIGSNAFANCTSLTRVVFENAKNIKTWGSNIFSGVTGKKDGDYMMIGNSVILKAISKSAPDARYEISSNVAYIADNAFADVNNSTVYLDLRGRDNAPVLASSAFNGIAGFKTIVKNGKEGNFNSKVWSNINTTTIEVPSEKYTTCMFMYNAVVPEGIAVYTAKSNAEGKVVLTKINKNNARTVVPAGVGFMLRADNKTTATFVSAKDEAVVSVNENELKGAKDYTYFTGDENPYVYILSTVDGKQGFYRAGSTNKLKIGKAYLQSNTQIHSLAKMSLWEGESETSGISDAQMSENSNAKGYVYNLNGSRMSSPQKGVNIINGKKVIIK